MTIRSALLVGAFAAFFFASPAGAQVADEVQADQAAAWAQYDSKRRDQTVYEPVGEPVGGGRPVALCAQDGRCAGQGSVARPHAALTAPPPSSKQTTGLPGKGLNRGFVFTPDRLATGSTTVPVQREGNGLARPRRSSSPCTAQRTVAVPQLSTPLRIDVTFATGSAELNSDARANVQSVAAILGGDQARGNVFVISGHADCVGDDATNLELSQRRAESVRALLIEMGVPGDRIKATGFGEERRPAGVAYNSKKLRRVEVARLIADS